MAKNTTTRWDALSMRDRASLIKLYSNVGVRDLNTMRTHYNKFAEGGWEGSKQGYNDELAQMIVSTGNGAPRNELGLPAEKPMELDSTFIDLTGVGDIKQGIQAVRDFREGNTTNAGIGLASMLVPNALEGVARPLMKQANRARRVRSVTNTLNNAVNRMEGMAINSAAGVPTGTNATSASATFNVPTMTDEAFNNMSSGKPVVVGDPNAFPVYSDLYAAGGKIHIKPENSGRMYPLGGFIKNAYKVGKNIARSIVNSDSRTAEHYSKKNYTFEQAYNDARKKGQKTFYWGNDYFNTDYEGVHGRQYKQDVASGKAAAFDKAYPGFTNPELRKEKQEELDTYGITNEQTKNKTAKEKLLRKIPARGYDVNDAISAIKGEHTSFSKYNSVEELIAALKNKYLGFKDIPLTGGYVNTIDGEKAIYLDGDSIGKMPIGVDYDSWLAFENDVNKYDKFNVQWYGNNKEIHRQELDYLLGYPLSDDNAGIVTLDDNIDNKPIISKYKTGSEPYYYTTTMIEASRPIIPNKYLDIGKNRVEYDNKIQQEFNNIARPFVSSLPENHTYDDYVAANEKDEKLPQNKNIVKEYYNYINNKYGPFESFVDKMYSDENYRKSWNKIGVDVVRGGLSIDYPKLIRSGATDEQIDTLGMMGGFDYLEPLDIKAGNQLAGTQQEEYYLNDSNNTWDKGKYTKLISRINPSKEDHNRYSKEQLDTHQFIYSEPSLGTYTLSMPNDSSYVSIWDIFDIDPFGSGNDRPIIQVGKPFEYYTRFYPEGKEPDIDRLYDDFTYKFGGSIHIKPENRGKFNALLKRTGKSASWFKEHGTPLQRKRATFALNARKWKHADGGDLEYITSDYLSLPQREAVQIPYRNPKVSNEELIDSYINNALWVMENPRNKGFNKDDNKYYSYEDKDAQGNIHVNIGPGLEKNGHPDIDYTKGYTKDEINRFARKTVANRVTKMSESLDNMQNGRYSETRDTLSIGPLLSLVDIAYNGRTTNKRNLPEKWPTLVNDLAIGDLEAAKKETYSGSKRRQLMRNDLIKYGPITKNTVKNR